MNQNYSPETRDTLDIIMDFNPPNNFYGDVVSIWQYGLSRLGDTNGKILLRYHKKAYEILNVKSIPTLSHLKYFNAILNEDYENLSMSLNDKFMEWLKINKCRLAFFDENHNEIANTHEYDNDRYNYYGNIYINIFNIGFKKKFGYRSNSILLSMPALLFQTGVERMTAKVNANSFYQTFYTKKTKSNTIPINDTFIRILNSLGVEMRIIKY